MTVPSSEPWAAGFQSYAGWVPNVRSHLSFSRIAATRSADCFTMPVANKTSRVVLVLQSRASNDYPLWTWLAERIDPQIRLHWFMDGQTEATELPVFINDNIKVERDRQGQLVGTLTLVPFQERTSDQVESCRSLQEITDLLGERRNLDESATLALRDQARGALARVPFAISLNFALMRTGECRIWYEQAVPDWDSETHDDVAEQAYYFIKDVAHDHTHHDPSDDQITPLIRFDPASSEEGHEDEIAWRRETMWSLSREIERRNREGGLVSQRQSLGIIAYAESFQNSLMSHVRDSSETTGFRRSNQIHDFDFAYLKDSVRASVDVLSTEISQAVQILLAFSATLISSIALASSLLSARNSVLPRGANNEVIGAFSIGTPELILRSMAAYPLGFGLIMATSLMIVVSLLLADGRAGIFNRAQRTVSQFGRAVVVTTDLSPKAQFFLVLTYHVLIAALAAGVAIGTIWLIAVRGLS